MASTNRIWIYLSILLGGLLLLIAGGMIGYLAGWKPSQYSIVDVGGAWSIAIGILLLGLFMIAMGLYLRFHDRSESQA